MAQDGINWFMGSDPHTFEQNLSLFASDIDDIGEEVAELVGKAGAKGMMDKLMVSHQENKQIVGGPAIKSGALADSIGSTEKGLGGRGRAASQFGFINGAPNWTEFKEEGTSRGMIPMKALTAGYQAASKALNDELDKAGVKLQTRWNSHF